MLAGSPFRIVFVGQSLNIIPASPNNYPTLLMAEHGVGIPYNIVTPMNLAGAAWYDLDNTFPQTLYPLVDLCQTAVLVMCGGTSNIQEGQTGQQYYDSEVAVAQAAAAAGFAVIVNTTLCPSAAMDAGEETARAAANVLKLANSTDWDACVDLAAHTDLDDPANTTYYSDGTHWTAAGAQTAADLVYPALQGLGVLA